MATAYINDRCQGLQNFYASLPVFKRRRLGANIKLTLRKALIR